jgi:hypothetical protein
MLEFETTPIWLNTLAEQASDPHQQARARLRQSFFRFREKCAQLASHIPRDLRDLTVHDITHLDSLWETASLVAGPAFALTPAEAFIFGGAVLLHDAGMSLSSYPRGLADLQDTIEWRDAAAYYGLDANDNPAEHPAYQAAVFDVLRLRHAQQAERLATLRWHDPQSDSTDFLLDDAELRDFYGATIGLIAHSHWWNVAALETRLPRLIGAARGIPSPWTVDPIKVACLLRLADAIHIDQRRAPRFLRMLTHPTGHAALHWTFQGKLSKPVADDDAIVFSSGPPFLPDDAEAW